MSALRSFRPARLMTVPSMARAYAALGSSSTRGERRRALERDHRRQPLERAAADAGDTPQIAEPPERPSRPGLEDRLCLGGPHAGQACELFLGGGVDVDDARRRRGARRLRGRRLRACVWHGAHGQGEYDDEHVDEDASGEQRPAFVSILHVDLRALCVHRVCGPLPASRRTLRLSTWRIRRAPASETPMHAWLSNGSLFGTLGRQRGFSMKIALSTKSLRKIDADLLAV